MSSRRARLQTGLFLWFVHWRRGMTLGVRAAVFDRDGRVLLVRHTYLPGWYFPGGGVEPGETAEAAIIREVFEEGAVRLASPLQLFGLYLNRRVSKRDHVALFVARIDNVPAMSGVSNYEIREARFFALGELPENTTAATRRRLEEIAERMPRSSDW